MKAVEFTTALGPEPIVKIPGEIAARLPKEGHARVIILTGDDSDESEWHRGAYQQFVREDAVYDSYR